MARIHGTNTTEALEERSFPYYQFTFWKGSKKVNGRFGKDLEYKFRLELSNNNKKPKDFKIIKNILGNSYQLEEDENGSLFLDNLNIIPYSDNPETALFSALTSYKQNKPLWFCDKKNIHTKFIGERKRPVKVNEPCFAKDMYSDCPKGCKEFASFYFEILELRMLDMTRIVRLQLSSINDIINLSEYLDKTNKDIGKIRTSPFYSSNTQRFVIHRLTRISKENSYRKINYPLHLELHPLWLREYNHYLSAQEIKKLGYSVPKKVLAQIHGEELINDLQTVETTVIEDLPLIETDDISFRTRVRGNLEPRVLPWQPSPEESQEMKELVRKNWTRESFLELLRSRFNITDVQEIANFTKEQYYALKEALKNPSGG